MADGERVLSVAELGALAREKMRTLPRSGPETGLRPEHKALLDNALAATCESLDRLATQCESAVESTAREGE